MLAPEATILQANEVDIANAVGNTSLIDLSDLPGVRSVRWIKRLLTMTFGRPIGVVSTDGSAATVDAIRDRLVWSGAEAVVASRRFVPASCLLHFARMRFVLAESSSRSEAG